MNDKGKHDSLSNVHGYGQITVNENIPCGQWGQWGLNASPWGSYAFLEIGEHSGKCWVQISSPH